MSSVEPDDRSGEIDRAEEVGGACIVSGGNRTVLLECGEEILDQMSGLLHVRIVVALFRAV